MLTKIEKAIIQEFNSLRIPAIYKIDNTFNILYVEHIHMDICPFLLQNKKQKLNINEEKKAYSAFLANISVADFNDEAKHHLNLMKSVMSIFFKSIH